MNDKELQKIIDTKNGTISVLKDTVKKWVREYNMLDACIELQNEKINAYKMSENEANEIIAELKAEIKKYAAINEQETKDYAELKAENERLKREMTELEEKFLTLNGKSYSYYTTLQEIKAIVEENKFYFVEGTIIRYETIKQIVTNFEKILDLITKAEEE